MDISQIQQSEKDIDSFDYDLRLKSFKVLIDHSGQKPLHQLNIDHNMHIHSFYSFNCYGYSPMGIAWRAKKADFSLAGMVDFDVLDGLDEFRSACNMLDLPGVVGMETRVFLPDFSDMEFTSPGEPGITYFVGLGFTTSDIDDSSKKFLSNLKATAQQRNSGLAERVNKYLSPVELDYEKDVLSLTPAGNPTERHLCAAYIAKAQIVFPQPDDLAGFWSEKLDVEACQLDLPDSVSLVNALRKKCMKQGGVGYVKPDRGQFPDIKDVADFITVCGGVPAMTWLNGTAKGEQHIEDFIKVSADRHNVSAIVIIPDRNYTPGKRDDKLKNLYDIVAVAEKHDLLIAGGTEMNSPGQNFVNDFHCSELRPISQAFLDGACGIYGHTVMQDCAGMGLLSDWARDAFADKKSRNDFYIAVGKKITPASTHKLNGITITDNPSDVIDRIRR